MLSPKLNWYPVCLTQVLQLSERFLRMKMLYWCRLACVVLVLEAFSVCLWANPKFSPVFGDHMVLQQDQEIRVWGSADPDELVTITIDRSSSTIIADKEGRWRGSLPSLRAGGPFELQVAGKTKIAVHDVLVGEVWIASGQSNMTFPLRAAVGGEDAIKSADYPNIRFLTSAKTNSQQQWKACSPDSVAAVSAVAFFFARDLNKNLGVPIGIIVSAYPGSTIEQWSAPDGQLSAAGSAPLADGEGAASGLGPAKQFPPSYFYQSMVEPLFPLSARGVLWYQGENNVYRAFRYRARLEALIKSWRAGFRNDDLQFLIVQLSGFGPRAPQPRDSAWAELREAQAQVAKNTPGTGMVVTIDLNDGVSLHPPRKLEVGQRLAALALGSTYKRAVVFSGPVFRSAKFEPGKAVVTFAEGTGPLAAQGGLPLEGFALAGADRKFHWGNAEIQGNVILITSPDVPSPVAVRYAWADHPPCNLKNDAGLPAAPFRSDDWPGPTARRAEAVNPGLE